MAFVGAAIGGAAVLGGGFLQAGAARDAAKMQAAASERAAQLQYEMFMKQREDQAPWRQAGGIALSQMGNPEFQRDFTKEDFQQDPGYQFRMQEGQKALERSAAAKGGLQSGGTLKALSRYGQDFASNEYGNAYNRFNANLDRRFGRLSSLAGLGQTANNQVGAAAQNYGNNVSQNYMSLGNALGASRIAEGNAWGGTINSLGKIGQDTWMKKQQEAQGNKV